MMSTKPVPESAAASNKISKRIEALADWRGETLAWVRQRIHDADPEIEEEWKWEKASSPGTPVWSHDGIVCTGESYKQVVKLTFAQGAALEDPHKLFNSSLEGNVRRAIDIREGDKLNAAAFKALIRSAVAANAAALARRASSKASAKVKSAAGRTARVSQPREAGTMARSGSEAGAKAKPGGGEPKPIKRAVVALSGGNPRIAKGDGDAPVQDYIAGMPGWKRDLGKRLDALIVRNVPSVRKAVKWNSPFYGVEGQGWFLALHTFTRYVKVAFFRGTALRPVPPGVSTSKDTRYIDIHQDDEFDEAQMAKWVKQAARLPGWAP